MDSLRKMLAFFIPMALQGASMSLTYPLVGSVVSHGRLGPDEYAVFAQAQAIMFLVGSVGNGILTTGMVFARSKTGMRNFTRMTILLAAVAAALQLLCCIPPFDGIVLGRLYHLEGDLLAVARNTLFWCIPLNVLFFLRGPALATLFVEKRSAPATLATAIRIGLTWAGSAVFVRAGLVGWAWGTALTTFAVFCETALFQFFAQSSLRALVDTADNEKASVGYQLRFTIPLSLGGTMINISAVMVGLFLTLTDHPEDSRAIHYIAISIVNPLCAAALRMQTTTIAFPPKEYGFGRVQTFAFTAGVLLSSIALALQIPAVARWYFCDVQNLSDALAPLAKTASLVAASHPFIQALRGHAEGLAAIRRRPNAILSGQIAYLAALVTVFFLFVHFHTVPGYLAGAISIAAAQGTSMLVIRLALLSNDFADEHGVAHVTSRHR